MWGDWPAMTSPATSPSAIPSHVPRSLNGLILPVPVSKQAGRADVAESQSTAEPASADAATRAVPFASFCLAMPSTSQPRAIMASFSDAVSW